MITILNQVVKFPAVHNRMAQRCKIDLTTELQFPISIDYISAFFNRIL